MLEEKTFRSLDFSILQVSKKLQRNCHLMVARSSRSDIMPFVKHRAIVKYGRPSHTLRILASNREILVIN